MIAVLSQKMENRFWDFVIAVLTRSQLVRRLIQWVMNLYENKELTRKLAIIALIACAGFASGILAFTFVTFF